MSDYFLSLGTILEAELAAMLRFAAVYHDYLGTAHSFAYTMNIVAAEENL